MNHQPNRHSVPTNAAPGAAAASWSRLIDTTVVQVEADAMVSGPALLLRPWRPADAAAPVEMYRDDGLRRWTSAAVADTDPSLVARSLPT